MTGFRPSPEAGSPERSMLALLVCRDRTCRAAFEAEGSREAINELRCEDCGGPLRAVGWANAEPTHRPGREVDVRRAA
ncbi:MAG TPA: hypothetical protein VE078_16845 [Thermoanaerobaculia bacterium]|nr:hypothetical protein [Thermoanaerobaculia bacterium]